MPGSCTYRSPVPAKEWHKLSRSVPLLEEKGGEVSLSLSKITKQFTAVCSMMMAGTLCWPFPGGTVHPRFLCHKGEVLADTKLHHSIYWINRQLGVLCWLLCQVACSQSLVQRLNDPRNARSAPGTQQWWAPAASAELQAPHSSQVQDKLTLQEISFQIPRVGVWAESWECTAKCVIILVLKCSTDYSGPLVTKVLGSCHSSGQHTDALKGSLASLPPLGTALDTAFSQCHPHPALILWQFTAIPVEHIQQHNPPHPY